MKQSKKRDCLLCGIALLLFLAIGAIAGCTTVKDGKIEITNLPADCTSVSITLSYTENGVRRAETLGGKLSGTTWGPVSLANKYLDRTYQKNEITIAVECGTKTHILRNKVAITVPAKGTKKIDKDNFR